MRAGSGATGFTLIEILVALTVLALVLAAGFEAIASATRALDGAHRHGRALLLARSKLDEARATERLDVGEARGEESVGDGGERLVWWRRVEPYPEDGLGPVDGLPATAYLVTVGVGDEDGRGRTRVELGALVLNASERRR